MAGSLEVHQPRDWKDAWRLLSRAGTHAVPLMFGTHPEPLAEWDADTVVDLSLLGLEYIKISAGGEIRLGALTRLQELVESPGLKTNGGSLLSVTAQHVAPIGMRNLASIGGALYENGGPPEVMLALLVLDACVVLQAEGDKQDEVPIADFLEKSFQEVDFPRVIVEVKIPSRNRDQAGWGLERVARTPRDAAIVAAVAYLEVEDEQIKHARLSIAGINSYPKRFPEAEKMLVGQHITDELWQRVSETIINQVNPVADFRGSAAYRQAMVGVLSRRVLQTAWQRAIKADVTQPEG